MTAVEDVRVTTDGRSLTVYSGVVLSRVRLVSLNGTTVAVFRPEGGVCVSDVSGLAHGLYMVVCESDAFSVPQVRKVILR